MVKYCVLFEVRTEFLNNIYMSVGFKGLTDLKHIENIKEMKSMRQNRRHVTRARKYWKVSLFKNPQISWSELLD
jgi:hypothetical protein